MIESVTRMTLRVPRVLLYDGSGRPPLLIPNVYWGRQVIGLAIRLWRLRRYRQPAYRILSIVWARPGRPVTESGGSERG